MIIYPLSINIHIAFPRNSTINQSNMKIQVYFTKDRLRYLNNI